MLPTFRLSQILLATVGAVIAVSVLAWVATSTRGLLLLGSFGASTLLVFALPEAALSQPRAVVCGHLTASLVALACLACFGPQWWAMGLATGLSVGLMMLLRVVHPPAGSNAIIVFFAKPGWGLLLFSTLAGAAILIVVAILYHRATRRHRYPLYWRRPEPVTAIPAG